jgi:hypothetical protein
MSGVNLALRFGLELAALAGLATVAWRLTPGVARWGAVIALPLAAAVIWGTFNVPGDPRRSGSAPIVVPGWLRLDIELGILGCGAVAFALGGRRELGLIMVGLVFVHYAASVPRVTWLLRN